MIERFVDVSRPDGTMTTFVVHPDENGPHPVVLFLMDAPGMREEIRMMCRRVASAGYYVMSPQLYYRDTDHFNVFETGDRDRMFTLMSNLSNQMATDDAGALIELAGDDAAADATKVGVAGYCMSGPFTIMIAAAFPQVKAAASIHGVALVTEAEDSPHKHLHRTQAEIYVAAAETDSYAPPEMLDAFEAAATEASANVRVEWYPGTEHGFSYAERPVYDRDASERHWERIQSLFRRNLS